MSSRPGAQTERWGGTGPVSVVLGGVNSPAAFVSSRRCLGASRRFVAAAPALYYSRRFAFSLGAGIMAITIEAVYENGVPNPAEPLPLTEHERVQITILSPNCPTFSTTLRYSEFGLSCGGRQTVRYYYSV